MSRHLGRQLTLGSLNDRRVQAEPREDEGDRPLPVLKTTPI